MNYKHGNRKFLYTILPCFCFMISFFLSAQTKEAAIPKVPPPAVITEKVSTLDHTIPKEYIGVIQAIDEITLNVRVSGVITGIHFKEGGRVKKGQLLVTIEDTTYKAKAMICKSKLAQVEAELKYYEINYNRKKVLAEKNAVSKAELDDAGRYIEYSKARVDECKASLIDAENDLSYTKIYAPITGMTGAINQTLGDYVTSETPSLIKIESIDPIYVKFSISERDFLNIFKSRENAHDKKLDISIRLANDEIYPYKGKVAIVDNVVDPETGTIAIWSEFPNTNYTLIPGGYVTVLLSEEIKSELPAVSQSAVMTDNRGNYVYVLEKRNIAVKRDVTVGKTLGSKIIILEGLNVGETVISDGTNKVILGQPVKPYNSGLESR